MKKSIKKVSAMLLLTEVTITILSSTFYLSPVENNSKISFYDAESEIYTKEFQDSLKQSLFEKYGENYQDVVNSNIKATKIANEIDNLLDEKNNGLYPNYYGGNYINDNQELVIQVVKNKISRSTDSKFNELNAIKSANDNVLIEYVDNSFNELKKVDDYIIEYFSKNSDTDISIVSNYVDVLKNKVIVELENNSIEEQEKFKEKIIDSEYIEFLDGQRTYIALNAGEKMWQGSTQGCSVGFRATLNGKKGFVTAGHCTQKIKIGEDYLGYGILKKQVYGMGQRTDASFIETDGTVTNDLQYSVWPATSLRVPDYNKATVGTLIGKSGWKTGGTQGKITVLSQTMYVTDSITMRPVQLVDQTMTNVKADGGDSGGPVFLLEKSATIVGIVEGSTSETHYMNYTKMQNIKADLGIFRY